MRYVIVGIVRSNMQHNEPAYFSMTEHVVQ
jgi:hypothetical protein